MGPACILTNSVRDHSGRDATASANEFVLIPDAQPALPRERPQGAREPRRYGRFYERHCFTMYFEKTVSDSLPQAASYLTAHKCVPAISRFFVEVLISVLSAMDASYARGIHLQERGTCNARLTTALRIFLRSAKNFLRFSRTKNKRCIIFVCT